MTPRTVSWIARALGPLGLATIVAACAAPVGTESEMATEEAVAAGPTSPCANTCPSDGAFGDTTLEQALLTLGCGTPVGRGNGAGIAYQSECPVNTKATFPCGQICFTDRFGKVSDCEARTVTGNIFDLAACSIHFAPVGFGPVSTTSTSACGCGTKAPAGTVYAEWEESLVLPTCSSGSCSTRIF